MAASSAALLLLAAILLAGAPLPAAAQASGSDSSAWSAYVTPLVVVCSVAGAGFLAWIAWELVLAAQRSAWLHRNRDRLGASYASVLAFDDVHVLLSGAAGSQTAVLAGVSGAVARGGMMAVMGPSGCGKSTLLNVLAGYRVGATTQGQVFGSVTLDGRPRGADWNRRVGFVPQDDLLLDTLTARECLAYAAALRLPWHVSAAARREAVEATLGELGLKDAADQAVSTLSGGQRRRVSIGMELVAAPQVLLLDEPTSGLDSATATVVVGLLRAAAKRGTIVVTSIHQPSSAVFHSLDTVLLLAQGRAVWCGPAAQAAAHFESRGLPCPAGTNMADHILDAVSDPAALAGLLQAAAAGDADKPAASEPLAVASSPVPPLEPRSLGREVAVLTWRAATQMLRSPLLFGLHIAYAVVVGLLLGEPFFCRPQCTGSFWPANSA